MKPHKDFLDFVKCWCSRRWIFFPSLSFRVAPFLFMPSTRRLRTTKHSLITYLQTFSHCFTQFHFGILSLASDNTIAMIAYTAESKSESSIGSNTKAFPLIEFLIRVSLSF